MVHHHLALADYLVGPYPCPCPSEPLPHLLCLAVPPLAHRRGHRGGNIAHPVGPLLALECPHPSPYL